MNKMNTVLFSTHIVKNIKSVFSIPCTYIMTSYQLRQENGMKTTRANIRGVFKKKTEHLL